MERLLRLNDHVILFLVCIHVTMASGLPPEVNSPRYITVKEDVPIGSIIGSLTAIDPEGLGHVNVVTVSTYVVRIEESTTPGNWSIILNTNLDRETTTSYTLSFTADTCGSFPLSIAMSIFVQDVNDVSPRFENLPYNIDLKEDIPSGQIVYTSINASDPDEGIGGRVNYYMQDMTQHPAVSSDVRFSIDVNSGHISFAGQLDYETIKFYHYKVTAVDGGNLSSTTDLFINVTDVQDTEPYFSGLPYMLWLPENTPSGASVYKINALDGDTGVPNNVTYSFVSADPINCSSFFGIDNATGEITVTSNSLDRDRPPFLEKNGVCEIIVQAVEISTDPGPRLNDRANSTLTLTVTDVNDNVPTFSNNRFIATITENSGPGTPLTFESGIQISVSDADQGANSDFSLGLSNTCLSIRPTDVRGSANINLYVLNRSCFDFEVLETMTFKIIATESTTRTSSSVNITLTILNENDNDPTFHQTSYNGSVVENVKDRPILQVHATDNDAGIFGNISYSLEGDSDRFTINNKTGEITTKDSNLDRETKDTYLLTVVATDGGGRRSGVPLAITVTDVNDETPAFLYSYASRIAEGSRQFASNLMLQANDNDQQGSENSHVIYRIATCKPNVCSNFTLDENSGLLAVNSPLDYEKLLGVEGVITITVSAIDNGTPQLTGNTTVQITVEDINDVQPVFSSQTYTASVPENAPSGTLIQQVHANDSDGSAPNNDVFYIIASGSNDQFVIDGNSGNFTTVATLNRESVSSYALIVLAIDRGSPAMTASTTVHIEVTNVNDDPPRFEPPVASVSVNEEINPGSLVCNFSAHDGDSDASLSYSILWQNSSGLDESQSIVPEVILQSSFKIDNSTGFISVNERLDRETLESAILLIMVVDTNAAANTVQTATGTVSVRVNDVNDHVPVFSPNGTVTANVTENSPTGTPLQLNKDIIVLDVDKDANSDFSLTISDHTTCLEVTPVKARREATVLIRVSDPKCFDYEFTQTLEFQIIATESTTRTSSNVSVTLTILNENDNDPTFNKTSYNGSVVENVKDHLILQVHATDNDAGMFGSISYSLEGDRDRFTINNETGEITTKNDNLDRETKDTYLLTVVATDSGGRRSGVPLSITVTDANDETPAFLYSYASRIAEGSRQFAPNLTLQANDNDQQVSENSHVIYRIATCKPDVCSNFTLDENSGLLTVNSPLDYEKLLGVEGVIIIIVQAIDNGTPQLTGNTTVQITVEDKNDVQPVFSSQTYTASVPENAPSGQSVTQVSTSDGDGSAPNNVVFYVLESGGSDNFRLNSTTGVITVGLGAMLDREKFASYSLTVLAIDRGYPPLSSTVTVSISLYDVNDEPPTFLEQTYEFSIYENAPVGDVNFTVTANDPDTNHDLEYSLLLNESQAFTDRDASVNSSIFQSWFDISANTGSIRVASPLDREMAEVVILRIAVRDRNGTSNLPQTTRTTLRITLLDVNDNEPVITPFGVLNVSEALTVGREVTTLTAMDHDKDQTVSFFVTDPTSVFQTKSDEETTTPVTSTPLITTTSSTPKITTPAATPSPSCNTTGGARKLFTLTQSNFDLNSSSTSLLVINSHLDLSNIGNNPSVKLALYPPDSFLQIQTTDNKTFSVYTTSVMPEVTKNYHFFLEAEVMAGNETARDFAHLTINVKRVFSTSPPVRVSFVLDGMRKGGIIYDLSSVLGNVEGLGLTLSSNPNTNLYVFSPNQTSIVCNRDVRLSEFRSNADSIAHQHVLTVSTSQGTVLTLHAVIVLNRYSKQIPEVSPIGTLVADFASLSNDFSISGVPTTDQIFVLTSTKVTLGQKLNYENPAEKQFKFNISLVLKSNGEIKTEIETEVIVTDVNDEPPEFKRYIYPFSTWTGAVRNPVIGFLEVTDKDSVSGFSYFIEPIEYSKYFEVLSTNGVLQSKDDLKNLGSSVTFNVSVSDGLNGSKQSAKVTISIFQSQNDNLTVVGNSTVVSVQEEEPPGKLITNASMANYIGYRLLPDYNGSYVTIDAGTGVITTTARLDREDSRMPQLIFSVLAYHKDNTCDFKIVRKITIVITDINDNAPAFTWEGNYSTSLPENSSIGTTVFQVLASDKDLGNNASILFNLYGQSSAPFSIGSQSGIITVANSSLLDREQNETIRVVVIAMDGGSPQRSATATLTIRLTDVNDNSPVFDKTQYTFSILENLPAPVTLGNVSATDKDIGLNGEIGYFYNGPDYFEVDRVSGVIRTTRPLDRELTTKYSLTIYAYDNGSPRREGSCTVMITVNDVNDNAPKFERQYYLINISEANDCFHSAIATLHANDSDEGLNSQVFYTITNTLLSVLTINSSTGMITCKASGLDYEIPDERDFTVQVTATDRGSPPLNGSVTVRVKLTDVNDNAPVFTGHPYNVSLPSEIFGSPNATVYVVSATDRDSNENGAVFYTLTTTDAEVVNLLWMDTNTGVIRVNKTSSTFQSTSHEFLVVASDRGHPPRTDNTSLILNVLNNEDGETIKFSQSDFHITIEEEKPPNVTSSVGKLESSPPGLQAKFTLAKNSVLYVNTSSGDLFCNVTLDRETLATYEILATVADNTSHSYAIVFVTVSDVNDHRPKFLLSEIQMVTDIQENSLIGTSIFIITAEDADAGNNSVVSYYLPETNIPFAVGVSDGQLTVNGSLDREWLSFYTVVVVAKDNGFPPLDTSATVTIYITDDNDNAPTFLPPEITPIPEDASWNRPTWSAVVKATDPDYGVNGTVKYTVLNTQACPFKINDGKLSLQDDKTLDYETATSHTCIIQASDSPDSGALSTIITVFINVTDVNDNDPVFQHVIKSHNVSRDVGIPYTILANLTVTDADSGINAEIWFDIDNSTFAFDLKSYFDINAVSGEITIRKPLSDFPLESVNLTIVAHDRGEQVRTATVQIEVFVSDENTPPRFSQEVYSINITEEDYRALLEPLLTVRAYDFENQTLVNSCNCTYTILDAKAESGRNVSNYFSIDSSTGIISLTRDVLIDREMTGNSICVKLTVTDKGMPPKTATATLGITVWDVNDNAPLFSSDIVDTTITKSKCKHRQVIYNATARDVDIYPNNIISYRLNPHQSLSFTGIEISETTGELLLIYPNCSNENIENERILVVISATDGKYNTSLTISISVNLSDSNPNGPVFSKQLYSATVLSSDPNGTTLQIPDFGVTDNDGNNVTYAIEKNNLKCTEDVFRINSASGKITLQSKLDQFSLKAINLTITAADYGDFSPRYSKTGTTTVSVTVIDYSEKVCFATDKADELQSRADQFNVFRGLFIAIVLLWALTIVISVALFYKWRVVRYNLRAKQSDTHTFDFPPLHNDADKGSKGKADTTGLPPELPRREGSHGTSSGDSGFRNPAFTIDQDKDGYLAPSEHGTSTGQFSSADSMLSNLSLGSSRDTYAGGAAYMPLLPEGPSSFSQPTYLTPSSVIRGKADDPKGTYLHAVPEERGPDTPTYLHATVKPDDIQATFP